MKYHPGKIVQLLSSKDKHVIAADASMQAVVRMWDENIITVNVHKNIQSKIKNNDTVLIDYNPLTNSSPIPKTVVCKILRGEAGKNILKEYASYLRSRKKSVPASQPTQVSQAPRHSYG